MSDHKLLYVDRHGHRQYVCECGWLGTICWSGSNLEMMIGENQRDLHSIGFTPIGDQALPLPLGEIAEEQLLFDTPLHERGFGT